MPTNFQSLSSWGKLNAVPFYFFYYYVPTRYTGLSAESDYIRRNIWSFKDGLNQDQFVDLLATKLGHTFGNAEALTLVCIPASTIRSNINRYERFSNALCSKLHMTNGFQHITIIKEKSPCHLGGSDVALLKFDKNFFSRKKVVLFDDVVTTGSSMQCFIDYLGKFGAEIVCCMSLGRTYWDRYMSDKIPHPWTGNAVFSTGCAVDPDLDNRPYVAPVMDEITQTAIADKAPVKEESTDNAVDAAIINKILYNI